MSGDDVLDLGDNTLMRGWDAQEFLDEDYSAESIPADELALCRFIATQLELIGRGFARGLEVGCGPALVRASQLVRWVQRLDLADYAESNLEQIRRWLRRDPDAHDWSRMIGAALQFETRGGTVAERETLLRARTTAVMRCDVRRPLPLGDVEPYDLIATAFCLEWATATLEGWRTNLRHVVNMIAPDGWLIMLGVHDAEGRLIKGTPYRCARVTHADIWHELVALDFEPATIHIEVERANIDAVREIFMVRARKRSER